MRSSIRANTLLNRCAQNGLGFAISSAVTPEEVVMGQNLQQVVPRRPTALMKLQAIFPPLSSWGYDRRGL
jgi:hypothetical protein